MACQPTIEAKSQYYYVAIRQEVPMSGLGSAVQHGVETVAKYLGAAVLEPSGPPFVKYVFINMPEELIIEVGFPIGAAHSSSDPSVSIGIAPSGNYVCSHHVGAPESLVSANAALQYWAASNGIVFDVRRDEKGEYWAGRFEHLLLGPETESNPEKWVTLLAYRAIQ